MGMDDAERDDIERLIGAAQDALAALERLVDEAHSPMEHRAFAQRVAVQMRARFDAEVRRVRRTDEPAPRDRLQAFVYRLARDNVVPGVIEEHVQVVERNHRNAGEPAVYIGEGAQLLGAWAAHIAKRLIGDTP